MKKIKNKSERMLKVEKEFGEEIEELLRRLYVDEDLNFRQIADKLKIHYTIVSKWMRYASISSKKIDLEG